MGKGDDDNGLGDVDGGKDRTGDVSGVHESRVGTDTPEGVHLLSGGVEPALDVFSEGVREAFVELSGNCGLADHRHSPQEKCDLRR